MRSPATAGRLSRYAGRRDDQFEFMKHILDVAPSDAGARFRRQLSFISLGTILCHE